MSEHDDDDAVVDWNRRLANFRPDTDMTREYGPCPHHPEDLTKLCDNCDSTRCAFCLDSCPCMLMEAKGVYLSFGNITRCCFCGYAGNEENDPSLVYERARWGHAYAHRGCVVIRANRLVTNLDRVLAKPEPLPDVFSLLFEKVCPEIFAQVDRQKILLWCEGQTASIH